jgi:hypothetical protein
MSNFSKPLAFYRTNTAIRITPDITRRVFWIDAATTLPGAHKGIPEKGTSKFNWEDKLIIALSPEEGLGLAECANRILITNEGKVEFFHDPQKGGREGEPKSLFLNFQKTDKGEKVFLSLSQGERKVSVLLSRSDLYAISTLVPYAVSAMWNWTGTLPRDEDPGSQPEPGYNDGEDIPF